MKLKLMKSKPTMMLAAAGILALSSVGTSQESPAAAAGVPTFTKDVAPILQRSCQVCHRPGAIAPMSLLTYDEARPWARAMKQQVVNRVMPPWTIDKNVGIQHFKNDRTLKDED